MLEMRRRRLTAALGNIVSMPTTGRLLIAANVRESCTVGALRATARGHDVAIRSTKAKAAADGVVKSSDLTTSLVRPSR